MACDKDNQQVSTSQSEANDTEMALSSETSPGVKRMEAISRHLDLPTRIVLFVGIFIVAYVYSLDITLRYAFQPTATDSFKTHSLLATVQVLRSVIASAAQPTAAKIADVVGRVELLLVSVVFYVVGTIVDATSHGVKAFSAGAVLCQIGYTCVALLVEVIVADTTSLRSRLLFSYIPVSPFLINAWFSGDVASATLSSVGWRWGIGMWGIIYPASIIPLVLALWWAHRRAKSNDELANLETPYQLLGARKLAVQLFWQLDVIGILLIIAILALILVPLTLAGGIKASWKQAHISAPLIVGILCIPAYAVWESRAPHPAVPFTY